MPTPPQKDLNNETPTLYSYDDLQSPESLKLTLAFVKNNKRSKDTDPQSSKSSPAQKGRPLTLSEGALLIGSLIGVGGVLLLIAKIKSSPYLRLRLSFAET
jgi:hypothetical protein